MKKLNFAACVAVSFACTVAYAQNDPTQDLWEDSGNNTQIVLPSTAPLSGFVDIDVTSVDADGNQTDFERALQINTTDSEDFMAVDNGTSYDNMFLPILVGHRASSVESGGAALSLMGTIEPELDSEQLLKSMMIFDVRRSAGGGMYNSAGRTQVQNQDLFLWRNYTTELMLMDVDGNLGLNTSSPAAKFHVNGSVRFQNLPSGSGTSMLVIDNNGDVKKSSFPSSVTLNCTDENFIPKVTGTDELGCSQIQDDGSTVGINGISNTYMSNPLVLYVNGDGQCTGNWYVTSDRSYKKNITELSNALRDIQKLRGVSYSYRAADYPEMNFSKGTSLGLIAQEVEEVFPELVITSDQGYKAVNYNGLVPVLIQGIKEQQSIIEQQQSAIGALEDRLSAIEGKLGVSGESRNLSAGVFSIYPNPNNGRFTFNFQFMDLTMDTRLVVINSSGEEVSASRLYQTEGKVDVNMSNQASGLYIAEVLQDGKVLKTIKFIIE